MCKRFKRRNNTKRVYFIYHLDFGHTKYPLAKSLQPGYLLVIEVFLLIFSEYSSAETVAVEGFGSFPLHPQNMKHAPTNTSILHIGQPYK